jgi:septal ring-binding cell division protein DamX
VNRQPQTSSQNFNYYRNLALFNELSGSIAMLVLCVLLVAIMLTGLFGSYQDHFKTVQPTIMQKSFNTGEIYSLPPRKQAINKTNTLQTIKRERVNSQPVLAAPTPQHKMFSVQDDEIFAAQIAPIPQRKMFEAQTVPTPQPRQFVTYSAPTPTTSIPKADVKPHLYPLTMDQQIQFTHRYAAKRASTLSMEKLVDAGRQWLSPTEYGYSVQIMLVSSKSIGNFSQFLNEMDLNSIAKDLHIFPIKNRQNLIYFGRFNSANAARKAITLLPDTVQQSGAFMIRLKDIRNKVARNR